MNNRMLVAGLVLLAVMSILIRGFLRDVVVVPLLYASWIAYLLIDSTSRLLLWGLFVLIATVVAVRSLARRPVTLRSRAVQPARRERVADLARLIDDAPGDLLSRWQVAQRLGQVTLQALADQGQVPPQEMRKRFNQGTLEVPPEIRAYIQARLPAGRPRRRTKAAAAPTPLDLDPEYVVRYLEDKLSKPPGGPA